jgi:hypothetical protein
MFKFLLKMDKLTEYCRSKLVNRKARDWEEKGGGGEESARIPHFGGMQLYTNKHKYFMCLAV